MASNAEVLGLRLHALCKDNENAPSDAAMQSFIVKGANVNTKDEHGWTVLHYAVENKYLNAVVMLLAAEGIDIDMTDNNGNSALMWTCKFGHIEIAKVLVEAHKLKNPNFDISSKRKTGYTFLMYPCIHGNVEIVRLLLSVPHISIYLKCNAGKTAFDYTKGNANGGEMRALFRGEYLPLQL
jgi:ankyrin repeat protein